MLIYRQFHGVQWTKFLYAPIALALSSGIYVACYIVLRVREPGRSTSIIQLALWTMAFIVEVAGHWFNPDDEPNNLIGYGSLTDRLGSVTVIILGEGKQIASYARSIVFTIFRHCRSFRHFSIFGWCSGVWMEDQNTGISHTTRIPRRLTDILIRF